MSAIVRRAGTTPSPTRWIEHAGSGASHCIHWHWHALLTMDWAHHTLALADHGLGTPYFSSGTLPLEHGLSGYACVQMAPCKALSRRNAWTTLG